MSDAGNKEEQLSAKSQQVDKLLDRWISKTGPGAAVMVIHKHAVLNKRGYGLARLDQDSPMPITATTNFRLASLTKQFTGMAVAMLIEEKKLNLNDRLTDFFPEQPAREIRIHHLLHHTAGLSEYDELFRQFGMIDGVEFQAVGAHPSGFEPKNSDVLSLLKGQTLLNYPPGSTFAYSNSGYACLAAIVEKASEMSYSQFLKCRIFDKLGMAHTFVGANPDRQMPDLAYSYDFRGVGTRTDIDYSPLNTIYGDDGVYSNLEDLYKWDQALVCACDQTAPAKPLVSDKMLDLIFRPGKLNDGTSTDYGFGWSVAATRSYVDHDGEWLGFRTYIRRYLNDHFSIIVLSNFASIDPVAIAERIDAIYFPPGSRPNCPRAVSPRRAATKSAKASNATAH
jgi:CubicO group peptidase (beta-lactamase class C family)